ncbi:hypothetical protein [Acanthopleuribacter pedis]|uniref:Uncharacterized protein n=1 Tax=Acanthopleuribacter pedis TaxID=442870 RepID=A0A8J7QDE2_9BACT|nr:hypothetical protein [Acanthopleuribacter pedis]MBO1317018.1 hypothetical protein [Acanthopleuribacter pedis]
MSRQPRHFPLSVALFLLVLGSALPGAAMFSGYKTFFKDGEAKLEAGDHQGALADFQEAFRLENKASRYRLEGAIFANYLPRYKIALAYEPLDIMEAEAWIKKSTDALEEEVIKRQRKELAKYHADKNRIQKAAEEKRKALAAQFNIALSDAQNLLNQKKFAEARRAFQKLVQDYPNRPEAQVGLGKVDNAKLTHLRTMALDAKTAIIDRNFAKAETVIGQIERIDAGFGEIASLKQQIVDAKRRIADAADAEKRRKQLEDEKNRLAALEAERKRREALAQAQADNQTNNQTTSPPRENSPPQTNTATAQAEQNKAALREALLATLKPYRRGDPGKALSELQEIAIDGAEDSLSFRWLKGIYLLGKHHHSLEPDEAVLDLARGEILEVQRMQPDFRPDPGIYPRYVIEFFGATGN